MAHYISSISVRLPDMRRHRVILNARYDVTATPAANYTNQNPRLYQQSVHLILTAKPHALLPVTKSEKSIKQNSVFIVLDAFLLFGDAA